MGFVGTLKFEKNGYYSTLASHSVLLLGNPSSSILKTKSILSSVHSLSALSAQNLVSHLMLTNCYFPLPAGHLPKCQRASQWLPLDAQFDSPPYPVLPSQVFPSLLSTRPTPHAQRCEFLRFTQISLQPPLFCSHSLSSVEGRPHHCHIAQQPHPVPSP